MKKLINIGSAVDTGDGDYLRKGAIAINDSINDIYHELGDDNMLFSAGAWKIIDENDLKDGVFNIRFGQSIIVNTTRRGIKVHLPKGAPENIGKSIKLRDVFGTWLDRPVEVKPASGDTIKGVTGYTKLHKNLMDVEMVYTSKGRWEYVESTSIDKHESGDLKSVIHKDFIAHEGQTDFTNPFGVDKYNPLSVEVYRRGNKLYYGDKFNPASEYGSIGETGELVELDGQTIKLKDPCEEGDTISFVSYIDGVETFRTSHTKRTYKLIDTDTNNKSEFYDNDLKFDKEMYEEDIDGNKKIYFSLQSLGIETYDNVNPYAMNVYLNGVMLTKVEDIDGGRYYCYGADKDYDSPLTCQINGGEWIPDESTADYNYVFEGSTIVGIEFSIQFEDQDILVLEWFNNIIGATLTEDQIRELMDESFVSSVDEFYISNRVAIEDVDNIEGLPTQKDVKYLDEDKHVKPSSFGHFIDILYPVGSIYMNLYNKESPELIMGFGKWRRMSGYVLAGFNEDYNDSNFGQNHNFLDNSGNPTATPGGTIGSLSHKLGANNIPQLENSEKVLVKDPNGDINIGSCMIDPEDEGATNQRLYSEKELTFGIDEEHVSEVSNLQPTMVVSMWVRVE